jgi:hypothetical protein
MSNRTKAFILRKLLDPVIIEEALKRMNCSFIKNNNNIIINQFLSINIKNHVPKLIYTTNEFSDTININCFISDLTETYTKILDEKIQKLKIEELKMKEKAYIEKMTEEKEKEKQLEIERERLRLEAIKRKEEADLKKQIEEKTEILKQKAMQLGYQISEEVHGKEKVLVLIRR